MCSELGLAGSRTGISDDRALVRTEVARQLDAVFGGPDPDAAILGALSASVSAARYWQDPDDDDLLLTDSKIFSLFSSVADAVGRHSSTQWWSSGVSLSSQVYAVSGWTTRPVPLGKSVAELLRDDRAETVAGNERMREHRREGGEQRWAITSGTWWTPPIGACRSTTRIQPGFGPVELSLQEDAPGYDQARSWPVSLPEDPRVFEIDGADSWADLVERYPIDVTFGRGANWLQATQRDGAWAIPDWQAVSVDYDAVHLTVLGYLAASGRSIDIDGERASFIAGWNPDETYWLTDVEVVDEHPDKWVRNSDQFWERAV